MSSPSGVPISTCCGGPRRVVVERLRKVPGLVDPWHDQEGGGLQANVTIDRGTAARLGVDARAITGTLNDVYAQRQISTIFGPRNQYRVVLGAEPHLALGPEHLSELYVAARDGKRVPFTSVARVDTALAPLSVYHQGQFAAATIGFSITPETTLAAVTPLITTGRHRHGAPGRNPGGLYRRCRG